ncbi:MAG TPA: putative quinol monooxygenase [Sphingomonas sp.]|jgi:quinol monooxygenase YgiN|nr:putative quinol monooxygenase [Sphingomonas sp.]
MLIVTGALIAEPGKFTEALAAAQAHTRASRAEPGCISHDVYPDPENPDRLFFYERWESLDALKVHFGVTEARGFSASLQGVAKADPDSRLSIYEASQVRP